jgi:hypothetical protein
MRLPELVLWLRASYPPILQQMFCSLALFLPAGRDAPTLLSEPDHVVERQEVQEYWGLVGRVAATHQPVIVRRGGADVAAMITVKHLELLRELLAQHEAEQLAAQVDWAQAAQVSPPPPHWFEGNDPKPF